MSFEKLVKVGQLIEDTDKPLYQDAYDSIVELFMKMLDSTGESIKGRSSFQVEECYYENALKGTKTLNQLGRKVNISLNFPETDKKEVATLASLLGNCMILGKMK